MRGISSDFTHKETHRIPFFPGNRLLADSRLLGWQSLYASVTAEQSWQAALPPLAHDCLVYCLHGRATIERRIDDQAGSLGTAVLHPRQLSLIPAGKKSEWSVTGRPEILLIYFNRTVKKQVAESLGIHSDASLACSPFLARHDAMLEQVCLAILRQLRGRPSHAAQIYTDQLAKTALMHVLTEYPETNEARSLPPQLNAVVAYIGARLGDSLKLNHLAKIAGCSEQHLARLFRRTFDQTPPQYITDLRIARARTMLAESSSSVQSLAQQLGFSSQSHFTSTFRHRVGVTPTQFRNQS